MNRRLDDGFTRRDFMKAAMAGAIVVGAGGSLSACGGGASSSATPTASVAPKRGGVLRVGVTGGGPTDNIDAGLFFTNVDGLRLFQLYNSLYAFDKEVKPQLSLAEEATHNSDATEWTVRLRSGVTFHDGKDLTAEDVIFTFQRILDPKLAMLGANFIKSMDIANVKKLDNLTVKIPFHVPYPQFPEAMATYFYFIVPVGYTPKHPIGTGPFKYESFTPGQESVFSRNDNYWQSGMPYVDKLIISDYSDETSQVNALSSHQLDLVNALSNSSIPMVKSGGNDVLIEIGECWTPFTMRTDMPPFTDVRVRQAFRLVIDRPQMLQLVFGGHGLIGNDLFDPYDRTYNHSIPQRTVDIEQARSLLKQAGQENLSITLISADVNAGMFKAAQIFAQQASAAGIKVNVRHIPVSQLYGPNYTKWQFAQDAWNYNPYLFTTQYATIPGGLFNECHVNYPPYTKLWKEFNVTVDPNIQSEIAHEMQLMEWNGLASGFIVPYFVPQIDGMGSNVRGLTTSKIGNPFGGFDLQSIWLA